jgi:hypothetical protein
VLHWSFLAELAVIGWAAREFRALARFRDLKRALQARMVGAERESTE